jgi:hypothetical protein
VTLDIRYVAGLFDGEGWFQIDRARPKGTRRGITYQVHARITMRDHDLLVMLRETFSGSLRKSAEATDKRAAYWSWDVCGENCSSFALDVGPHLQIKAHQARLAVAFQAIKRENKNGPMSDQRFARLTKMYDDMRLLNRKGVSR